MIENQRRPLLSDWQLHTARSHQDEQLRSLFSQVFGHAVTKEEWEWKYREADLRGSLLIKSSTGETVAFFGGMPRAFSNRGKYFSGVQNGDVMVRMQERGVFSRKGALFQVAKDFFTQHIGRDKEYAFAFGFPNSRHFQLGIKLDLYAKAAQMQHLRWVGLPAPWYRCWSVRTLSCGVHSHALDLLWQQMLVSWPEYFLPVRTAKYWEWRYQQRPGVSYELLLVSQRLTGRPLAAIALRLYPEHCDWVDYIGSREHLPHAIAAVRAFAFQHQRPVHALISDAVVHEFSSAQPEGLSICPSEILIPTNAIDAQGAVIADMPYIGRLWLMSGDSDFM